MTHPLSWNPSQVLPWRAGLAYGLLGLPLADPAAYESRRQVG